MDKNIIFDYMKKDRVCSHVEVDLETKKIEVINYTDNFLEQAFGKRPLTMESLNQILENRCFDRNRKDKQELLQAFGLTQYNALDIVRKTHGAMIHDFFWIRFEGENLTWKDVGVRN